MDLRFFRVFSTELLKLATEVLDSDIRARLAEKKGKEYLEGGKLPSNSAEEQDSQIKIAYRLADPTANPGASFDLFKRRKKKGKQSDPERHAETYKKVMDTGATAAAGGFLGNRLVRTGYDISNKIRPYAPTTEQFLEGGKIVHKMPFPAEGMPKVQWRNMPGGAHVLSTALGAGLALADMHYRRRAGLHKDEPQKKLAFASPATELAAGQRRQSVLKVPHAGHKPAVPGLTGRAMP